MCIDWIRNRKINPRNFDRCTINLLEQFNYIKKISNGYYYWINKYDFNDESHEKLLAGLHDAEIPNNDLDYIAKQLNNQNNNSKLIDLDSYLELSDDYSIFNYKNRINIYKLAKDYQ